MGRIEDDFTAFGAAMRSLAEDSIAKAAFKDSVASATRFADLNVARSLAGDGIAKAALKDSVASATRFADLNIERSLVGDGIVKAALQDKVVLAMERYDDDFSVAKSIACDSIASVKAAANARFVLPPYEQLGTLASDLYSASQLADARLQFLSAAESLKSPWMDADHPLESARGLAALVEIGSALKGNPFGTLESEALRNVLGDWREMPSLSSRTLADVGKRRSFYYENGLAPGIAALPRSPFFGTVRSTQPSSPPAATASASGDNTEKAVSTPDREMVVQSPEAEVAADRPSRELVACYEIFHMLERKLRRLVESALEGAAGSNWSGQRVPPDVLSQWRDRKKKAENVGDNRERIIEFAEMGDYPKIICRKDNWKLFEPTFQRREFLQEAFNRLIPLRHAVAHHRELSNEDLLFLQVEAWRLCKAMGTPLAEFPFSPMVWGASSAN
jgi:Swt1-like HEPN